MATNMPRPVEQLTELQLSRILREAWMHFLVKSVHWLRITLDCYWKTHGHEGHVRYCSDPVRGYQIEDTPRT